MSRPASVDTIIAAIHVQDLRVDDVHECLTLPASRDPREDLRYIPTMMDYVGSRLADATADLAMLERVERDRMRQLAIGRANFDEQSDDDLNEALADALDRAEDQLYQRAKEKFGAKARLPTREAIEREAKADSKYLEIRAEVRAKRDAMREDPQLQAIQQSIVTMTKFKMRLESLLGALRQKGFGLSAMKDIYVAEMRSGLE